MLRISALQCRVVRGCNGGFRSVAPRGTFLGPQRRRVRTYVRIRIRMSDVVDLVITPMRTKATRHSASTEHSLTFRVRAMLSYPEVEASLLVGWSLTSLFCTNTAISESRQDYNHYDAIATQPVHRLQIRPIQHNQGHPLPLPQVTSASVQ